MQDNLNNIISKLLELSGNERNNLPLPDDNLLDQYEKDTGFKFSPEYRKVLKEAGNISYGTIRAGAYFVKKLN